MNRTSDVLIIGGGITGLASAYYLDKAGRSVRIIERGKVGSGSSQSNCGLIVPSAVYPLCSFAALMQRLTTTHVRRWHLHRETVGCGHLYQGTYKSFPIESDEHLLTVLCYVERNALRAGMVERAELWRRSSLWRWRHAEVTEDVPPLTE